MAGLDDSRQRDREGVVVLKLRERETTESEGVVVGESLDSNDGESLSALIRTMGNLFQSPKAWIRVVIHGCRFLLYVSQLSRNVFDNCRIHDREGRILTNC